MAELEQFVAGCLTRSADPTTEPALATVLERMGVMVHEKVGPVVSIEVLERAVAADPAFAERLRRAADEVRAVSAQPQVTINATASGEAKMPVLGTGVQTNNFG